MKIAVVHDDDMPWTVKHIEEIRKIASLVGVTEEQCVEMALQVRASAAPIPVIAPGERGTKEDYRIESKGECCGVVTLTRDPCAAPWDARWEVDIVIYEDHRCAGIASQALCDVLALHPGRKWLAKLYGDSPFAKHVSRLLTKAGFVHQGDATGEEPARQVSIFHHD